MRSIALLGPLLAVAMCAAAPAARSALFDEQAMTGGRIAAGWILFGVYMLAGTLAGAVCACVAVKRGLPASAWFALGVVLNVVAVAAILLRRGDTSGLPQGVPRGLRKVPTTRAPRPCPGCGAALHPAATRCGKCGAEFEPLSEGEVPRP